jgi:hypothetical protein
MQVRVQSVTKLGHGLMVTATATQPTYPAGLTDCLFTEMGIVNKRIQTIVLQPVFDVAVFMLFSKGAVLPVFFRAVADGIFLFENLERP